MLWAIGLLVVTIVQIHADDLKDSRYSCIQHESAKGTVPVPNMFGVNYTVGCDYYAEHAYMFVGVYRSA
jgi:hypothetical protein